MPDTPNPVPQPPSTQPKTPTREPSAGHVPMTEEFDSPKWSLPPVLPVVLSLAGVAIVVAILVFALRPKPVAAGAITTIATADQQGSTLVGVLVKLDNKGEKLLWVRDISGELETADGKQYPDHAAAATDAPRYLQAFTPEKRASLKAEAMREELKIQPGSSYTGFLIFSYPVDQGTFDARKALTVRIGMYDQPTVVLKQP